MGDVPPDLFDRLPEDVTQIIFGAIYDCKSLVRCMTVSQAFYRHAVRISSLSIVCPDNYCSYEEKLKKIYSMVKGFRELQTLVVRVGQPKDESASWAHCMRYAEIGASVEKFMFMAAKSGDFSELDCALARSECASEAEDDIFQGNVGQDGMGTGRRDQRTGTESESKRDCDTSRSGNVNSSETENIHLGGPGESRLGREFQNPTMNSELMWSLSLQRRLHIQGCPRIGKLSDFILRQVIAPSNDVMRRMLPVIHFAILQGLNEFRDVVPSFVANFPQLNRFLLVDLLESVTIYLRQHHLEEIRSFHPQDAADWECSRFTREDIPSKNSNVQKSLVHCSPMNFKLNAQNAAETPVHSKSAGTSHGNTEVQCSESKSLENGFLEGNHYERSDSDELCEVSDWKVGSTVENDMDCEANSPILQVTGRTESEYFDFGKNVESEAKVEKLRKAKGLLLQDISESTEQGAENLELVDDKSASENFGYSTENSWNGSRFLEPDSNADGVCRGDRICLQAERTHSSCGCEDTHILFHAHSDRFGKRMEEKSYPVACQSAVLYGDAKGFCSKSESLGDSKCSYSHTNEPSKNRLISFHKTSTGPESSHRLSAFEKLTERRCYNNRTEPVEERWEDTSPHANEDASGSRFMDAGGHLLNFRYNEGWDGGMESSHGLIRGDGCMESLQAESVGDKQEPYRRRISRCQDIFRDGKIDIASRYPFKRGSKNDSLRSRDNGRNLKMGSFITLDDSASSSEGPRNKEEGLGQHSEAYRRRREQFQSLDEVQNVCQKSGPMKLKSLEDSTVNSCPAQEPHDEVHSGCSSGQSPVEFSFQQHSTLKDRFNIEVEKNSFTEHNVHSSHRGVFQDEKVSKNNQSCQAVPMDNILPERSDQEGNRKEESSNSCMTVSGSVQANDDRTTNDRFIESGPWKETWRPWKETWRERVRRSRDTRRDARIQEDERRDRESQRRAMNAFQRRKNDLEKEALSFDYSFWRAEQVVAQNYRLSDVSMCIATYSAKPLGEADIDILSYAALAGPLLAATVSHVNKQHSSHNL